MLNEIGIPGKRHFPILDKIIPAGLQERTQATGIHLMVNLCNFIQSILCVTDLLRWGRRRRPEKIDNVVDSHFLGEMN